MQDGYGLEMPSSFTGLWYQRVDGRKITAVATI